MENVLNGHFLFIFDGFWFFEEEVKFEVGTLVCWFTDLLVLVISFNFFIQARR